MNTTNIDLLPLLSEMRARQLRGENILASKQRERATETQAERDARERNEIRRLKAQLQKVRS